MIRNSALLLPASIAATALLLTCSSCHSARTERTRAEANRTDAEADLTRAKAEKVRSGEPPRGEYVQMQTAPTPPPPPQEAMPTTPGPSYVWVPGYHEWNNGNWVWKQGHWLVPPQQGATWVPARWERQGDGWVWVQGTWR